MNPQPPPCSDQADTNPSRAAPPCTQRQPHRRPEPLRPSPPSSPLHLLSTFRRGRAAPGPSVQISVEVPSLRPRLLVFSAMSASHDPNSSELQSFPIFSAASGWDEQQLPSLPWLQSARVPELRRGVHPPCAAPAASASLSAMYSGAMDSERSFTDIITRGCNPAALSDNIPAPNETPACDEAAASVKGNQRRSKNLSKEEDELLVSAWLNVSLDPVHGVDQSRSTYWKRIYDYFHINKTFDSDRGIAVRSNCASRPGDGGTLRAAKHQLLSG